MGAADAPVAKVNATTEIAATTTDRRIPGPPRPRGTNSGFPIAALIPPGNYTLSVETTTNMENRGENA